MLKKIKKILYIVLIVSMVFTLFSCKQKQKHRWMEVGADPNPPKIEPGVHPERGSMSDAVPIQTAIIFVPQGIQEREVLDPENGGKKTKAYRSTNKSVLYEMEEITPESIDLALKDLKVISEDVIMYSFEIVDVENGSEIIGPGEKGDTPERVGVVKYLQYISSPLENADAYEGKELNEKDMVGKIDLQNIIRCVAETFSSNFGLTDCSVYLVDNDGTIKEDE